MAKHRADTHSRLVRWSPRPPRPRHSRQRRTPFLLPALALALMMGGGLVAAQAEIPAPTADSGADSTPVTSMAADLAASRQALTTSRGASRMEALEQREERIARKIRIREARERRAAERRRAARLEARQWGAPLQSYSISDYFGSVSYIRSGAHTGVDLDAVTGAPVTSVGPGTVTFAGYDGAYGYKVVVEHEDGSETWYCHLSAINAGVGSSVTNQTVLGLVGATGNVTGDHLHLELRIGGSPVDPVAGLSARGVHL